MSRMYQQTDKYLKKLKSKIRKEFNHYSTLSFDELNVIKVKKETKDTFNRLLDFNKNEYLKIVEQAKSYSKTLLLPEEISKINEKDVKAEELLTAL